MRRVQAHMNPAVDLTVDDLDYDGDGWSGSRRACGAIRTCWFNRQRIDFEPDLSVLKRVKAGYGRDTFSIYFNEVDIFVAQWRSGVCHWFRTSLAPVPDLDRDCIDPERGQLRPPGPPER